MVPTIRPSPNTSIFAPIRCGVDPVVETIVTSAAGSPRSSASVTAANTSRFIDSIIRGGGGGMGRIGGMGRRWAGARLSRPSCPSCLVAVQFAELGRLGAGEERFPEWMRTAGRGELAGIGIDLDERDSVRCVEGRVRMA